MSMRKYLSHAAIILSLFYLTLFVIDKIINAMSFIDNSITKSLLLVLCAVAAANAVLTIRDERRKLLRMQKKRKKQ